MNRSLERKIRHILIAVFALSFLVAAGVSTVGIYLAARGEYLSQMRSQVNIAQNLIADFIFGYDDHILSIIRKCPDGSVAEVKSYLQEELHFHSPGDIYYNPSYRDIANFSGSGSQCIVLTLSEATPTRNISFG